MKAMCWTLRLALVAETGWRQAAARASEAAPGRRMLLVREAARWPVYQAKAAQSAQAAAAAAAKAPSRPVVERQAAARRAPAGASFLETAGCR